MKRNFIFLLILLFLSCSKNPKELVGIWTVKSPHYRAIYSIEEYNCNVVGKIKYYNDDTYVYKETNTEKDIFLHKIKRKDSIYIDAISGATITKNKLTIKQKNEDTLEVTTYIRNKPLKEFWIKKKKNHEK